MVIHPDVVESVFYFWVDAEISKTDISQPEQIKLKLSAWLVNTKGE